MRVGHRHSVDNVIFPDQVLSGHLWGKHGKLPGISSRLHPSVEGNNKANQRPPEKQTSRKGCVPDPARHYTCTDEAGESPVDDFIIVGQYKRTPRLNLQTVLLARNCLSAVKLSDFKVLGTQPGFVDNLKKEKNQKSGGMTRVLSLIQDMLYWEKHAVVPSGS